MARCGELGFAWPDPTSLTILFGTPPDFTKQWKQLLRRVYGARTLVLGYRLFGRQLPLAVLPAIAQRSDAIQARVRECGSLAPLLAPFVQVDVDVPADFAAIRTPALGKGLSPVGWRWLSHQPAETVRKLLQMGWSSGAIDWINLLALANPQSRLAPGWFEAGGLYGMTRFFQLFANWSSDNREKGMAVLTRYIRLLPKVPTEENRFAHESLSAELLLCLQKQDFLLVQPGQSWNGLLNKVRARQQARLAAAQERAAAVTADLPNASWPALVGDSEFKGIRVTELTSTAALVEEGIVMDHCVGEGLYAPLCLAGESAILRLEYPATGARATLQLSRSARGKSWHIGQLAGAANARPPAVFWACAQLVRNTANV